MSQVILYSVNGQVCICNPTGQIPIEEVLVKDCPEGAIIVDSSTLPQGSDAQFIDAWVLNGITITVNITKAQEDYLITFNSSAVYSAGVRATNTLAGIPNTVDDATWLANVNANRALISQATTTEILLAIPLPTP